MTTPALQSAREVYQRVVANIEQVMRGQSASLPRIMAAFATGGHVLLDDYPGTGKTTLAKALARSVDAQFKRIQFTPDLLPSDILGVSIFDQRDRIMPAPGSAVVAEIARQCFLSPRNLAGRDDGGKG